MNNFLLSFIAIYAIKNPYENTKIPYDSLELDDFLRSFRIQKIWFRDWFFENLRNSLKL